jgi:hypothetical protein
MLRRLIAWLKRWLMESSWPSIAKDLIMTITKNRGPKKQRYRKLKSDIGKKVDYCILI